MARFCLVMHSSFLNSQLPYKGKPLIAVLLTLGLLNLHRLVALEMMFLRCKVFLPGKAGNADSFQQRAPLVLFAGGGAHVLGWFLCASSPVAVLVSSADTHALCTPHFSYMEKIISLGFQYFSLNPESLNLKDCFCHSAC